MNGASVADAAVRPGAIPVFIAYSHKDDSFRETLTQHLAALELRGLIQIWSDRRLLPGDEWNVQIQAKLDSTRLFLLLISEDFLKSNYSTVIELPAALRRHREGRARVVPVILRDASWQGSDLSELQALPKDGKAINIWTDPKEAWQDVVAGIERAAEKLRSDLASRRDQVKVLIASFGTELNASRKQFRLLAGYKEIHDSIHNLQVGLYNRVKKESKRFPAESDSVDELLNLQPDFDLYRGQLQTVVDGSYGVEKDARRILESLRQAQAFFEAAMDAKDSAKLALCLRKLQPTVTQEPSLINAGIKAVASGLRLEELAASMTQVCNALIDLVDKDHLSKLQDKLQELITLGNALKGLANEHDQWQNADNLLRRIESASPVSEELLMSWPDIQQDVAPLYANRDEDWAKRLQNDGKRLGDAVDSQKTEALEPIFRQFRSRTIYRFLDVDNGLKQKSRELVQLGEPIMARLEDIL